MLEARFVDLKQHDKHNDEYAQRHHPVKFVSTSSTNENFLVMLTNTTSVAIACSASSTKAAV
jgi:hypothetical protein